MSAAASVDRSTSSSPARQRRPSLTPTAGSIPQFTRCDVDAEFATIEKRLRLLRTTSDLHRDEVHVRLGLFVHRVVHLRRQLRGK